MNEIGSGAFAFTAALMVSSTLLERLCVSMYSWIDILIDLCVKSEEIKEWNKKSSSQRHHQRTRTRTSSKNTGEDKNEY